MNRCEAWLCCGAAPPRPRSAREPFPVGVARVRLVSRNGRDHTRRLADPSADLFFRTAS